MASHSNEECFTVTAEMYQEIVRCAAHDFLWAQYFLLINTCLENLKRIPSTPEQRDQANVEELLIDCLDRLADTIATLLPGGIDEFRSYLKSAVCRQRHQEIARYSKT